MRWERTTKQTEDTKKLGEDGPRRGAGRILGVVGHKKTQKLQFLQEGLSRAPIGASHGSYAFGIFALLCGHPLRAYGEARRGGLPCRGFACE